MRGHGRHLVSHGIGWLLAEAILAGVWRFFAGQVVLRRPGKYDSRFTTWAAPLPDGIELTRSEGIPRSRWARRPGWQRLAVRLAALTALWGLLIAPAVTLVLAVAVLVPLVAYRMVQIQTRRFYAPAVEAWWQLVAAKVGHSTTGSPMEWVAFGASVRWEPWTPLVQIAREDGPLRRFPRARAAVSGLATPIGERGWATRVIDAAGAIAEPWTALPAGPVDHDPEAPGQPGPVRRVAIRAAARAIRAVEQTRDLRARPRIERAELTEPDATFTVHYPASYLAHDEDVRVWASQVAARVPGEWEHVNHPGRLCVEFHHPSEMPAAVPMNAEVFARYSATELPIGANASGTVRVPLKDKTPHVSVSASTGWGKTTTANVMASHLLYHGWHGVIVDPKRVGYVGAFRGASPHVELRTSLPGQLLAIEQVREEMNRRYEIIEGHLDRPAELGLPSMKDNPELYFQPLFFLEDEKGSFTVAIKTWWKREGGGINPNTGLPVAGKGDPEPLVAEQEILWRGRAAAVHMITLAQQNNLNVFLSSDMRDQYMFRILSGPQTQSSWIMTFPGTRKRKVAGKKGRAVFGIGPEELHDVQLGAISDSDARECTAHGVDVARRANEERAQRLSMVTGRPLWEVSPLPFWVGVPAETPVDVPGQDTERDTPAPAPRRALTLVRETAEESAEQGPETPSAGPAELHENADGTWFETPEDAPAPERGTDSGATTQADHVVGVGPAAEFLGITKEAMQGRLKRARRGEIPGVDGETRQGGRVAFPRVALMEWHSKFRTSGDVASGE